MITLSSDFGWPYPAAMRGVIASRSEARIIDITHRFPRGDVRTAAFWLREILPYFPPSVHLVVVDPGVGTDRAILVVRADEHVLIGPDNGVLVPAAERLAETQEVFELAEFVAESATFHGRDVFAPLAARVHDRAESDLADLDGLRPRETVLRYEFPAADVGDELARGEVLVVDGFGNAITNIPGSVADALMDASVAVEETTVPVRQSYAHVATGEPLVTVGSHGHIELAVNGGRGASWFGVEPGDPVTIRW